MTGLDLIGGAASGAAGGMRIRGGVNLEVADNFSFNLNASAGFWKGEEFDSVQSTLGQNGLVPQISAGTVFLF